MLTETTPEANADTPAVPPAEKKEDKGSALFHFAVLMPAVDFARVEEVLLLTGQTQYDVASLFTPDG